MKRFPKYLLLLVFVLMGTIGMTLHDHSRNHETSPEISSELKRKLLLTPELIETYSEKLHEILKNHDFQGNIILALGGKVVFEECFGYADLQNKVKNDSATMFQLASVSKQFTAMGIALLNEKGLLSYDDTVKKYIPEFPYNNITIKHLLTHTSGLQNYIWLIENKWQKKAIPDNEDLIDLFVENTLPLNFPPGTRFSYCNTGYAILASVIERVSGQHYSIFMKENIFDTLGMHNTYAGKSFYTDTLHNRAKGYVRRGGRFIQYEDDHNDGIVGDKGVYASAADLLKWDAALYSDILLPQDKINELFAKNTTSKGDTFCYGFGWRIPKTDYPRMVYHNGWWHGYRAAIRRYTDDRNTLIILNNTNRNIFPIITEIQSFLYPDMLQTDTAGLAE